MAETRVFTVDEARALVPEVLRREALLVADRADLAELAWELRTYGSSTRGGVAEVKALEARVDEQLAWFPAQGIELKGVAPLLIDFPAVLDGVSVRLCWLEGDRSLDWYHRSELGFLGRRRLR